MSNFPLTKKYLPELEIHFTPLGELRFYINASDLESALQKATVVYGREIEIGVFTTTKNKFHFEYSGLLLGYQPIEKPLEPVTEEEIHEAMQMLNRDGELYKLLKRIKKAGVK